MSFRTRYRDASHSAITAALTSRMSSVYFLQNSLRCLGLFVFLTPGTVHYKGVWCKHVRQCQSSRSAAQFSHHSVSESLCNHCTGFTVLSGRTPTQLAHCLFFSSSYRSQDSWHFHRELLCTAQYRQSYFLLLHFREVTRAFNFFW